MWVPKPLAGAAGTFKPEQMNDSRKKVIMKLNSPFLLISVDNNLVRMPHGRYTCLPPKILKKRHLCHLKGMKLNAK